MTTLRNDLRYAARLLIKSPAFTVVAVATLAIGIGANAAIFSVVDAALLNPLPYPTPDRLVAVWETLQRDTVERREFSYPDYRDLRDRTRSFDAIAAWAPETLTMSTREAPARQVSGELASAAYFELLGVTPIAGRIYTKTEDAERDAHPVSLVSYAFWQRELGGVPAVGRGIVLNDRAFTIIGVLPKGFRGLNDNSDVWIPMGMLGVAESSYEQRGGRWHQVVARLKDGVPLRQANADVTSIARQLGQAYPSKVSYGAAVFSLQQEIVGRVEPLLLTLLAAVGWVLLLAWVNLANLVRAGGRTRRRETAIRAALGADRRRLVQQYLAEASLLSVVGAGAGLVVALWAVDDIIALAPVGFPSFVSPRLDGGVLLFVIAVTCGVGIVLGLLPAVHGSRADLNDALKEGGRGLSAGAAPARMRSALVVTQVALSLLLLVGAGLMVRTFINVQRVEVGFQPERALTMRVALPQKYSDRLPQTAAALLAQISAVSGVQQAAIGTDAPFTADASATYAMPEGATAAGVGAGGPGHGRARRGAYVRPRRAGLCRTAVLQADRHSSGQVPGGGRRDVVLRARRAVPRRNRRLRTDQLLRHAAAAGDGRPSRARRGPARNLWAGPQGCVAADAGGHRDPRHGGAALPASPRNPPVWRDAQRSGHLRLHYRPAVDSGPHGRAAPGAPRRARGSDGRAAY